MHMTLLDDTELADELQQELLGTIPLTRAMQLRVERVGRDALLLAAPLAPNANDKGCAFGGSMASLATLACWGLVRSLLLREGMVADIYVQDSQIDYLAPVWTELCAEARLAGDADPRAFVETFRSRGRARIALVATIDTGVDSQARCAARLHARFVAKRREEQP